MPRLNIQLYSMQRHNQCLESTSYNRRISGQTNKATSPSSNSLNNMKCVRVFDSDNKTIALLPTPTIPRDPCASGEKLPVAQWKSPPQMNQKGDNSGESRKRSADALNVDIDVNWKAPCSDYMESPCTKRMRLTNDFKGKKNRTSSPFPTAESWRQLSDDIWAYFASHKQSRETFNRKMHLRDRLHEILLTILPACNLFVVGSSMTGYAADKSDMDMCLMLRDQEFNPAVSTMILTQVRDAFFQYVPNMLSGIELIRAKVPILRFRDAKSSIMVDLNVNNTVGIRNTQLLTSYARMDPRVQPLILLVKRWANYYRINDAKNNSLSSYSLVLMVIHYLQVGCSPPVLPCLQILQPHKYLPYSDVTRLKPEEELPPFVIRNTKEISKLFLGFLDYFSNKYNFENQVMSVRLGTTISKTSAMNTYSIKNKKGHWKCICIEEPFDLTNTASPVFVDSIFMDIVRVFGRSLQDLHSTAKMKDVLA